MDRFRHWIDHSLRVWGALPAGARAIVPVAIMGFLWWSSSKQPSTMPVSQFRALLHNGMHVLAYAVLGGSLMLTFDGRRTPAPFHRLAAAWSLLVAVAYGAVDELHQSYVPGRVCSPADLWADGSGAALAVAALGAWRNGHRACATALPYCVASSILSVVCATWGPW